MNTNLPAERSRDVEADPIANPGLPAHTWRPTDVDPRAEKRAERQVALLFGSANRDPRVFARPDEFDVGRESAVQHIGFGGGIHVCIGAPLARIELEASVEVLRRCWPDFQLAEEPRRTGAFVIWGLEGLRLRRA